jgi:hypothetical protein
MNVCPFAKKSAVVGYSGLTAAHLTGRFPIAHATPHNPSSFPAGV